MTIPAATSSPARKPSFSAKGGSAPVSATVSVRPVVTALSTARPSAPPICWLVLISPLARPDSASEIPSTELTVSEANVAARPTATTSDGPIRSATKWASAVHGRRPGSSTGATSGFQEQSGRHQITPNQGAVMSTDSNPPRQTDNTPSDFVWRVLLAAVLVDTALWLSLPFWW